MRLARRERTPGARVSLVPMVDVLMILLVFFMVTSTYLDLDTVPLAGGISPSARASGAPGAEGVPHLLVRIDAQGRTLVRGRAAAGADLSALVAGELARDPDLEVILLPSGHADVQALATAMDALVAAGATRLRVIRLEARP